MLSPLIISRQGTSSLWEKEKGNLFRCFSFTKDISPRANVPRDQFVRRTTLYSDPGCQDNTEECSKGLLLTL
jgi:hypothetical protein